MLQKRLLGHMLITQSDLIYSFKYEYITDGFSRLKSRKKVMQTITSNN